MPIFVLVALALAAVALGAVLVAVRQVLLGLRRLDAAADGALSRILPLVEDLQSEVAVSATETEALQERLADLRSRPRDRHRLAGASAATLD